MKKLAIIPLLLCTQSHGMVDSFKAASKEPVASAALFAGLGLGAQAYAIGHTMIADKIYQYPSPIVTGKTLRKKKSLSPFMKAFTDGLIYWRGPLYAATMVTAAARLPIGNYPKYDVCDTLKLGALVMGVTAASSLAVGSVTYFATKTKKDHGEHALEAQRTSQAFIRTTAGMPALLSVAVSPVAISAYILAQRMRAH